MLLIPGSISKGRFHYSRKSIRKHCHPMNIPGFSRSMNGFKSPTRLVDGSRVAVMGDGPAGSFFRYLLLDLAERFGIDIKVDIYEPRDLTLPAPQGCNMCAGVISETLVQNLAKVISWHTPDTIPR